MKIAISVPEDTFRRVESRVSQLGTTRSNFYRLAAESYLERLDDESLTERLSQAVRNNSVRPGATTAETEAFLWHSQSILTPEADSGDDDW